MLTNHFGTTAKKSYVEIRLFRGGTKGVQHQGYLYRDERRRGWKVSIELRSAHLLSYLGLHKTFN
jgi:hypothetical protein